MAIRIINIIIILIIIVIHAGAAEAATDRDVDHRAAPAIGRRRATVYAVVLNRDFRILSHPSASL